MPGHLYVYLTIRTTTLTRLAWGWPFILSFPRGGGQALALVGVAAIARDVTTALDVITLSVSVFVVGSQRDRVVEVFVKT